jgi:T5SS/PEP-CTERM-associated repeat protein
MAFGGPVDVANFSRAEGDGHVGRTAFDGATAVKLFLLIPQWKGVVWIHLDGHSVRGAENSLIGTMRRSYVMNSAIRKNLQLVSAVVVSVSAWQCFVPRACAVISGTGNFSPPLPAAGGTISGEVIVGVGNASGGILFGQISIDGRTVLTSGDGTIGDLNGAFGDVFLTGLDTAWNVGDEFTVGDAGVGSLSIQDVAHVNVTNDVFIGRLNTGQGEVFLNGLASLIDVEDDLDIGTAGVAYLQAVAGSQIRSGDAVIGRAAGSDGHVLLQDGLTQWTNLRDVVIGGAGIGRLDIAASARVNQQAGIIGQTAGAFGTVNVNGIQSIWSMSTDLTVGASGTGELVVSGGGQVVGRNGMIGSLNVGRGTATVAGDGSQWRMSGQLTVGNVGAGFLNIDSEGLVNVAGAATVGPRGLVSLGGGRLLANSLVNNGIVRGSGEITSSLQNGATGGVRVFADESLRVTGTVTSSGRLEANGGEMEFLSPVTNAAAGQIAARNSALRFREGLTNQGSIVSVSATTDVFGPVTNGATGSIVAAGDSTVVFYDEVSNMGLIEALPGSTIVFARDLALGSASSLAFEVAGLQAGEDFAQVDVAGQAALAGNLDVGLATGFLPAAGNSFTLISAAAGLSGSFASTSLPTLPPGLSWLVSYSSSDVVLSVAAGSALVGDYNGNGTVEQADLDLVLLNWGGAGSPPPAGWVNDLPEGLIDQGELDGILLNWGNSAPAALGASAVPEPSGVLILYVLGPLVWLMTSRIGAAGTTPVNR